MVFLDMLILALSCAGILTLCWGILVGLDKNKGMAIRRTFLGGGSLAMSWVIRGIPKTYTTLPEHWWEWSFYIAAATLTMVLFDLIRIFAVWSSKER